MALLQLGLPPALVARSHRDYLPWLAHRCYDCACAYCLEQARVLEVDHVVPASLAPLRAKDPMNLLPACATCNGHSGKWDYHPEMRDRNKCPNDDHGYLALDPRADDVAVLFELGPNGSLVARPGPDHDRALWNRDVLLRLNRPKLRTWRRQAQDLATVAEQLVEAAAVAGAPAEAIRRRDVIAREVATRLLFFELFELPLSDELRALAGSFRDSERGPAPS